MFDPMAIGILILVVVGGYFLMIRPANKRMRDQQQQVASIQPGSRVMLTSGIFGTVRHVGDKQMVIELSPDCLITVVRQAVSRVVPPDEEEFEFEDGPEDLAVDGAYENYPDAAELDSPAAGPASDESAWAKPAEWEPTEADTRLTQPAPDVTLAPERDHRYDEGR